MLKPGNRSGSLPKSKLPESTITPAIAAPWPPRYLVAECDHDVRAPLDRPDQVRGGERVVDDQRHAGLVRHAGDALDVQDVLAGVGDHFAEEQLGVGLDGVPPLVQVVRVRHEGHGDAELLQRVGEQVVGSAVEAGAGHHMVPGLGDVEDREGLRGLAGAEQQRREAAFQAGDALFDGVLGGVADPGVDGRELGEREAVRGAFGAGEHERRRLVDRQGTRAGGAVRLLAGVDLAGFEGPGVGH